jgi:hypothetical protein
MSPRTRPPYADWTEQRIREAENSLAAAGLGQAQCSIPSDYQPSEAAIAAAADGIRSAAERQGLRLDGVNVDQLARAALVRSCGGHGMLTYRQHVRHLADAAVKVGRAKRQMASAHVEADRLRRELASAAQANLHPKGVF